MKQQETTEFAQAVAGNCDRWVPACGGQLYAIVRRRMLEIFPEMELEEDNEEHLIVYTGGVATLINQKKLIGVFLQRGGR